MERIPNLEAFLTRSPAGLANTELDCPLCGKRHAVPIGKFATGPGALAQTAAIAGAALGHPPTQIALVYDRAIEDIVTAQVIEPLQAGGLALVPCPLGAPGVLLDAGIELGDEAADALPEGTDLVIGAGSGVISDLTKWIATRASKPFMLIATAPSMNGHASITAAMTENGIKVTKLLRPAAAVIYDTGILARAPQAMLLAGMGDMTARAACNADWKLAQQLKNSYFCPLPYLMMADTQQAYLAAASGIGQGDPQAVGLLSDAVLLSALTMTILQGETSPSSGGEHVISHYWDYLAQARGLPHNLHGTQVGIATLICLALYEIVRSLDPRALDPQALLQARPSLEAIYAENHRLYGDQSASFDRVSAGKYLPDERFLNHVQTVISTWNDLWRELSPYLAPVETIRAPLQAAGFPLSLAQINRAPADAIEAMLQGPRYRSRYTILDLAWDLGVFPARADEVLARAGLRA